MVLILKNKIVVSKKNLLILRNLLVYVAQQRNLNDLGVKSLIVDNYKAPNAINTETTKEEPQIEKKLANEIRKIVLST